MPTLISIVALIASIWLFFGYVDNEYQTINTLKAERGEYLGALARAQEIDQVKASLVSKYNNMSPADLDKLEKLLPDSVDNVRLIIDINAIAARYGMSLANIKVEGGNERQVNQKQVAGASAVGSPDDKPYSSVNMNFSLSGPYQNFVSFLTDMEQSLRVADVIGIGVKPLKGNFFTYDMKIKTYWLK